MARDRESRQDGTEERVVKIRRCAAVVKGGRRFSFNALVVVGDKHGRVAWGYGKANEVPPAVEKAVKDAQDTMRRQKRIQLRGETIPHRVIGRFGGSRVIMVPAGPGTGVKAGPGVRDVLEACGVHKLRKKKRVGRGIGSGHGKTASRGSKGQWASAGAKRPNAAFEGGQMPLFRRIPKRGFSHATWDKYYLVVNVGDLERFDDGT